MSVRTLRPSYRARRPCRPSWEVTAAAPAPPLDRPSARCSGQNRVVERRGLAAGIPVAEAAVGEPGHAAAADVVRLPRPLRIGNEHWVVRMLVPVQAVEAGREADRR